VPQALHHGGDRRLLLVVRADPAKPDAKPDKIGAQRDVGLGPEPPGRAVIPAMAVGIDRGERGLADAAQAVQRRDGDAALIAGERRLESNLDRDVLSPSVNRGPDGRSRRYSPITSPSHHRRWSLLFTAYFDRPRR
jgi:hypothetical protein